MSSEVPLSQSVQRLILLRHAKSCWDNPQLRDHQRPLNKRGRKSAVAVGKELAKLGLFPELVLSSDSERTRETWSLMEENFPESEVKFLPELYHSSSSTISEIALSNTTDGSTIMIIAHNPGCSNALNVLAREYHRFPTGMAACLSKENSEKLWEIDNLILPRQLLEK